MAEPPIEGVPVAVDAKQKTVAGHAAANPDSIVGRFDDPGAGGIAGGVEGGVVGGVLGGVAGGVGVTVNQKTSIGSAAVPVDPGPVQSVSRLDAGEVHESVSRRSNPLRAVGRLANKVGDALRSDGRPERSEDAHNIDVHVSVEVKPDPNVATDGAPPATAEGPGTEDYTDYGVNGFVRTSADPLSTFSIDVDTASYSLSRRKLREGYLPPASAVRVEEFVNYLPYEYRPAPDGAPFGVDFEGAPSPFGRDTQLVRVGVQGRRVAADQRVPVHLTFLVDTSGSMQSDDKIGLVKYALTELTEQLEDGDTVAIVAYAGSAGLVLPPTPMSQRPKVLSALAKLEAGGSTAMGAGIDLAYRQAERTYHDGAVNRVVILSDGDANVGQTDPTALSEEIRQYAKRGITLTTAGFGQGNYKDTMMERLADDGDGNYFYIDDRDQARRVFVDQLTSTLVVIARDVKIQVEWHADAVRAYRLVGYENRDIADRDFRNDAVDAGEIGAGHRVTALYEVALQEGGTGPLATVRIRSKAPGPDAPASERSYELDRSRLRGRFDDAGRDLRMAVAAAEFAELLRGSPHAAEVTWAQVAAIARGAKRVEYPEDSELVELIEKAAALSGRP
ncbi:MAG: von Willebrand factor type A domain-containing protein [Myxococcota bacterium]